MCLKIFEKCSCHKNCKRKTKKVRNKTICTNRNYTRSFGKLERSRTFKKSFLCELSRPKNSTDRQKSRLAENFQFAKNLIPNGIKLLGLVVPYSNLGESWTFKKNCYGNKTNKKQTQDRHERHKTPVCKKQVPKGIELQVLPSQAVALALRQMCRIVY